MQQMCGQQYRFCGQRGERERVKKFQNSADVIYGGHEKGYITDHETTLMLGDSFISTGKTRGVSSAVAFCNLWDALAISQTSFIMIKVRDLSSRFGENVAYTVVLYTVLQENSHTCF